MDIPPDVKIKASIIIGSVYYFPEETFKSSDPHYFIVLNIDPINDVAIYLVCTQSKIENVRNVIRKGCRPETLIEITPKEYPKLVRRSIIDCNSVIPKNINDIVNKLASGKLYMMPEMKREIVDKLRNGVLCSDVVSSDIQKALSLD